MKTNNDAEIFVVKKGSMSIKDKKLLNNNGIITVEVNELSDFIFKKSDKVFDSNILLVAALRAIQKSDPNIGPKTRLSELLADMVDAAYHDRETK